MIRLQMHARVAVAATLVSLLAQPTTAQQADFQRDVRPLLSQRCFACHGPDARDRKAGLRLDVADGPDGAYRVRHGVAAIVPGDPDASELWRRVTAEDDDERMPPPESRHPRLDEEQLAAVRSWIEAGAPYGGHWAFQPVNARDGGTIDAFVRARLAANGLEPSPEADRRTLIRRVTFDLTGLPPTRDEIAAFLADDRPDAYERLVDDLLQRPQYGEHMARYWLDLVRFADTNGMHHDHYRDLTPYRDWVIRAFNDNLPYDRFVEWQLAGDLLDEPTEDQLVATGWHRLHLIIDVGTALPEESHARNVIDRVTAFGTGFLGLTVHCAQCHDHKFDPVTQKDFFRLSAFFDNLDAAPETGRRSGPDFRRGAQAPYLELPNDEQRARLGELDAKLAAITAEQKAFEAELALQLAAERQRLEQRREVAREQLAQLDRRRVRLLRGLDGAKLQGLFDAAAAAQWQDVTARIAALRETEPRRAHELRAARAERDALLATLSTESVSSLATGRTQARLAVLDVQRQALLADVAAGEERVQAAIAAHEQRRKTRRDTDAERTRALRRERDAVVQTIPAAMVMKERAMPRETRVFVRGQYDQLGERVERGVPAFLPPLEPAGDVPTRRDLAAWLLRPDHPLTSRVAVNRFWQQCFGTGLVATSEDLGAQGEVPSHPRLLDHLAARFVASGWDVKALMRAIVRSDTYRQTSVATAADFGRDPDNRMLARGSRFRMDAEMIRDQLLLSSGLLNPEMYGRSVKPPQPPGIWKAVTLPDSLPRTFVADEGDRIWRRSVYTFWKRGLPPPQMTILNAPTREYCAARRERTNTPLQALLLLNEAQYLKAARHLALRELRAEPREAVRLERVYETITSQLPDDDERRLLREALHGLRRSYTDAPELAAELCEGAELGCDVDAPTLAAWTMLASTIYNLDVARTRQ